MNHLSSASFLGLAARIAAAALLCLLAPVARSAAQSLASRAPAETKPIQDNSFLVEEAYNQERGVVQHISTFTRLQQSRSWAYTFTQEWPWPVSARHQVSYGVVVTSPGLAQPGAGGGLGDTLINYRFQLAGSGDARLACAPRATLIAPSGRAARGQGFGGWGFQTNLPVSVVAGRRWVTHWNAGATIIPAARNGRGERASIAGYNLGQSVVWLARPRFNVLLETVWSGSQAVVGRGLTETTHALLLSPGVRWALNFKSGLQIVPGIAVPVGVGPSAGEKGIFLYLSFEHPFGKKPSQAPVTQSPDIQS